MRELTIVYEGLGFAGKTTSIRHLAKQLDGATFELLVPLEHARVPRLCISSDAVTLVATSSAGGIAFDAIHAHLRAAADAIVFVADSQPERRHAGEECRDLVLEGYAGRLPPIVLQVNKRDLPTALDVSALAGGLFPDAPRIPSIAYKGIGVWEAFEAAALLAGERHDLVTEVRALLARRRA